MTRLLGCALALSVLAAPALAQSASNFVSRSGTCTSGLYETISAFPASGHSVTVRAQQIKSGNLAPQPMTDAVIPPFTPVRCFASTDELVLVLAEEGENYCGWVPRTALLAGAQTPDTGPLTPLNRGQACPTLRPMSVSDFCRKKETLGSFEALCEELRQEDGTFADNPIETKFLTWNANADDPAERTSVARFAAPDPEARLPNELSIFSVFKVWDVEASPDGEDLYVLIGPDQKTVEGWVSERSGTVWFSRLTTFFSRGSDAPILTDAPGTSAAEPLAVVPPNLAGMLDGDEDFDKYPVLVDNRAPETRFATSREPHLEVAFIGSRCGAGQLCSEIGGERIVDKVSLLDSVDVLFVMDATKSMDSYFPIVAEEVSAIALERASTTNRFAAVMYGDFLSRADTRLSAPMQIKTAVELTEIYGGDEFDTLLSEPLFIEDPMKDKPEAAFAALYQAIEAADWRDGGVRIVVHIADHGDRAEAPEALARTMKAQNILYIPIAVRGEFLGDVNRSFATQTQRLLDRTQIEGVPMGIDTLVTYDADGAQTRDEARVRIRGSLRGATELQDVISTQIASVLLSGAESTVAESNRYPPGYAQLVAAARKIYGIDLDDVRTSAEARTLAAKGYVAVPIDGTSADWDYFAAISQREVKLLSEQFDILCKSMHDTDAEADLSNALRKVIEILTGDVLSRDNQLYFAYFDNRDDIPLVNRTILGDGIIELGGALNSFASETRARVEAYRREACRTRKLLNLVDSNLRVDRPFEVGPDGRAGGLVWDESEQDYDDLSSRKFIWPRIGVGNVKTVYLPLSYLPRPFSEVGAQ